ncbi:hypothetical protein D6C88_09726 [Aureobasidium pullulans]|nr:hypothetical protein D6C88_09726 [Aureobasidium pullulans]
MLAAAPDPTLFSALSFSPCLAADISTHFCATNDDTSDIQALPRDLPLPSAIALLFLIPERQHALHHLYTGRLSIAPELLNSSVRLHCRHHHRQCHSLQYFKIWSDACLSPPPQLLAFGGKPFLHLRVHAPRCFSNAKITLASLQDGFAAVHFVSGNKNALALAIMHNRQLPGVSHTSYLCLLEAVRREQQRPYCQPLRSTSRLDRLFLQLHFSNLSTALAKTTTAWIKHTSCFSEHLKTTTTTTTSNFRRSLLLPSLPAAMRSLSFMVASLFVSALTLSSASNKIHSYIFKLKKLPDPLTPLFTAATTITTKEDLSLVYEFKISYFLRPSTFKRCRHLRLGIFLRLAAFAHQSSLPLLQDTRLPSLACCCRVLMPCFSEHLTTTANLCHDMLLPGFPFFGRGLQQVSQSRNSLSQTLDWPKPSARPADLWGQQYAPAIPTLYCNNLCHTSSLRCCFYPL